MYLLKSTKNEKGLAEFHVIRRVEVNAGSDFAWVHVQNFADQASYANRPDDPMFNEPMRMPIAALGVPVMESVATWLTTDPDSPYSNASILAPEASDLDSAKLKRWAEIKAQRDAHEFGGFVWDGSTFDSDPISQSRITGAVVMALLAAQAGQPFAQDWTLADSQTRTLSGAEMMAVGIALGGHVGSVHASARTLRAAIEAATTPEELELLTWPA